MFVWGMACSRGIYVALSGGVCTYVRTGQITRTMMVQKIQRHIAAVKS